ncbi:phosphomannomutase [Bartonella apis]|uniref:Phosphomannomutase n=1 Tax=Bartonella apis TaxID=1686310 RepID=A0A1R0FAI8_9HYPH|nr:phosphomannomutase [Bartonella apis]OLY43994.1 phosphomannomutase [Bartonella apis]
MTEQLKFGTSGLRGLVSDLTDDIIMHYTCAFLRHLEKIGKTSKDASVIVGYDLRSSSPHIKNVVVKTIEDLGSSVINAGEVPTPALALYSLNSRYPAIMVTGSHIPDDRNGLKFYRPDGEITKQDERGIVNELDKSGKGGHSEKDTPYHLDENYQSPPVVPDVLELYRKRCLSILPKSALQDMKIGVYQHSSIVRDFLVEVLSALGAKTVAIGRADHFVPVDTEALRDCDRKLALDAVRQYGLDALVSTDGDADRPLIAGSDGIFLKGDVVGMLTAKYLFADAVVTPVTSTSAVETSHFFEHVYRTSVGSPYVIAGMKQALNDGYHTIVGFEANGGVLLGSDISSETCELKKLATRDAMLPILALLGFAQLRGSSVQALQGSLPRRFTASNRLSNIDTEKAKQVLHDLEDAATCVHFFHPLGTIKHWDVIDGLRVIMDNGDIVHFRLSGNAPELRCYSEAASQEQADKLLEWGLENIARTLEKAS